MFGAPERPEIDNRTIKLLIGLIAISLAYLTNFLSGESLQSISASYYADGWARNIFVGFLFTIAAFLIAYNGRSTVEMILSKIASISAVGIAMFPCGCDGYEEIIAGVHGWSAGVMFISLAGFCYIFFRRASDKGHAEAKLRAYVYALCGLVILVVIVTLAYDFISGGKISESVSRLVFYGERAGLVAFGISWLTASHSLPLINSKEERYSLL